MISRDDMMLLAAALRQTRPQRLDTFYTTSEFIGAHTAWLDCRAEIDRVLQQKCPTFDRRRFHLLTEIEAA